MKVKIRNQMWEVRDRYARYLPIPEFHVYEGEQVPNPSWLSNDYISMTTGIPHFPIRSILRERIVHEKEAVREKAVSRPRTYKVESSKGDKDYTVTFHGGIWTCECVGYGFRQTCRHIVEAQNRKLKNEANRRKTRRGNHSRSNSRR